MTQEDLLIRSWVVIRESARQRGRVLAVAAALGIGAAIRLLFVLRADFPLNDGALFYLMTEELQRSHYALPMHTAYNGAGIPFAYPPLGLYFAALVDDLGPWPLIDVFRFLPAVLSLLTMVAFYSLARCLLSPGPTSVFALTAFALLPRSFHWLIMGGGVTRSLGFLLALLAIQQGYQMYAGPSRGHVLLTAALAGATIACHLEMALFAACSIGILFLAHGRSRVGVIRSLLAAGGALAASSPWWATVIARHGLGPFLSASEHGWGAFEGLVYLLFLQLTEEARFPLLGLLALLGALICLANRRHALLAWVVALFAVDPRSAHTSASVPLAMLVGVGLSWPLLPVFARGDSPGAPARVISERRPGSVRVRLRDARLQYVVLAFIWAYALVSAIRPEWPLLTALSLDERRAMRWAAEHTLQSSRFLVVTGDMWPMDRSSEWFPVLAKRESVATVQGSEWLPGFGDVIDRSIAVQGCAEQGGDCLECWSIQEQVAFDYVYVATRPPISRGIAPTSCCSALRRALDHDPRYAIVYDGPGATIFRREHGTLGGLRERGDRGLATTGRHPLRNRTQQLPSYLRERRAGRVAV